MKSTLNKKNKTVYLPLASELIHSGHINLINIGAKFGKVIVGLLTDEAISKYKNIPILDLDERKRIVSNIKNVDQVVVQDKYDYTEILNKIKPDYFIHGDDWKKSDLKKTRDLVLKILKKINCKLIEPKYTKNISNNEIKKRIKQQFTALSRVSYLKRLISTKKKIKLMEAHSPLSGLMIENFELKKNKKINKFDGLWSSSLTDSTLKGKPDNQSVDYSSRIDSLIAILDVTTKPVLFDADNGGEIHHLHFLVQKLEREGVSGICIEDKIGLKQNSLFEDQTNSKQDSIKNFCKKLKLAKNSKVSEDFMIVARIESLILGKSINDALKRAKEYLKSGADSILIHSKMKTPDEIIKFLNNFRKVYQETPVIVVPSTYSKTYEKKLFDNGANVIIYANQLLRASHKAMADTILSILSNERAYESEKKISKIKEILKLF